ncbi:hypothetical protein BDU57DRAFT_458552 [Ampelomyces quisqualis]|uniref:COP9 signalosome complex subunit 4 n=1 Tax=Ampelomyces quisqualis TaxID=50730 RepID=A0A6A5QA53_AMPQU|nr:hypothetical protein BDU57DRAFT_458552 [Ampelomyces quisqualis]
MASQPVAAALHEIQAASAADKPSRYTALLQEITADSTNLAANLNEYAQTLLDDSLGIVVLRPLLAAFVEAFGHVKDPDVKIDVGEKVITLLQSKGAGQYEEQDTHIKLSMADAFESAQVQDFRKSAQTLATINLESTQKSVTPDEKAKIWIRIIKNIIFSVQDKETRLHFHFNQARIYDSQRSFLDAAQAYFTISSEPLLDEEEREQALAASLVCAVLAPAGPQRGRMLAKLYKDDRAPNLEYYSILEKMFLDRLLTPTEIKAFAATLKPHHLAKTADGSTVLDKAVLEHNLLGASKLYNNIGFDQLGELLGVDAERSEDYAAKMLEQGRLSGYIDQIDRLIFFEGEASGERKTGHAERQVGKELRKWDANVAGLAEEVEKVTTMIQLEYPDFYAAQVVH